MASYRDRNRESLRERGREYYLANRERVLAGIKKWKERNPLKLAEYKGRRRARELAATIGPVDYESILERDGLWCYLCEVGITTDDLHFDHVIPLARGGSHTADNIRPTHAKCNLRKGVRLVTA
jgi:5-methylcytosine-specific restriction endonuclease McrA